MKVSFPKYLLVFLLIFIFACKDNSVTIPKDDTPEIELSGDEKALVSELNNYIIPLNTTPILLTDSELKDFDTFGNIKVIGLGEATHGTKEFFQMKHRLFRYFVEKHGYKIFAFEADMGECIYIDRYVTEGKGTINDVMKKMHFWTWSTVEVKELIEWMKQYNSGKSEKDKIHFLGVDCQYSTYTKDLVIQYLQECSITIPSYINKQLTTLSKLTYNDKDKISNSEYKLKCDSILIFLKDKESHLVSTGGKFQYQIMIRLIEQGKQYIDVITKTDYNYRDLYMAENTIWLSTLLGNSTKIVCWAHNGHLAKDAEYGKTGSQGYHLKDYFGSNYVMIGFSFNQGELTAMVGKDMQNLTFGSGQITKLPRRPSINYIFYAAKHKNFVVINKNLPVNTDFYKWINTPKYFINIGSVFIPENIDKYYYPVNLYQIFDAVIHFRKTTASILYRPL